MNEIRKHQAANILASFEDEGSIFLKSQEVMDICKGRKAEVIGTKKTYGGKEYIKTANGWKPVGKKSGAAKQAADFVHGDEYKQTDGDSIKHGDYTIKLQHLSHTQGSFTVYDKDGNQVGEKGYDLSVPGTSINDGRKNIFKRTDKELKDIADKIIERDKEKKKEADQLDEKKLKITENTQPYQGNKDAKWVRIEYTNGKDTLIAGVAIDKYDSKEKAIEAAKEIIKRKIKEG